MQELFETTDATGVAAAIRAGEADPVEVVEHAVATIEARDGELNCVVAERFEQALAEARAGVGDGPLAGVPFLVKDLGQDVAGLPSTSGSRLFADAVAEADSELVARYRAAGLIVLGKTNTPEFGKNASTEPLLFGPTRNPADPTRSVGGSSGGSAAAVAAGMVPAAHGNDGGGSLRIPASACGLIGLKPTRGRTPGQPHQGALAAPATVDHAMTTSVRDTALLLDVAGDPLPGSGYATPPVEGGFAAQVGADPGRLRVSMLLRRPDGQPVSAQVAAPTRRAAERLEALGHAVAEGGPGFPTDDLMTGFTMAMSPPTVVEIDARLERLGRELADEDLEPFTRVLYDHYRTMPATELVRGYRAIERAGQALGAFFSDCDLLLTPTLAEPVPELGWLDTTDPAAMYERAGTYSAMTSWCNVTGQPAISLPMGVDDAGLPVGIQLVAAFGREDLLLRVAAQLEAGGALLSPAGRD